MITKSKIINYISKACEFLVKDQNEDGSWSMKHERLKEPPVPYQNSLILTSQALQCLIFGVKPKYVNTIKKGLNFCLNKKLNNEDSVDLWAWRLSALNFSDVKRSEKIKSYTLKLLEDKQRKDGSWPYYPGTFTLTNYSVCSSIKNLESEKMKDNAINWFRNSEKNKGWSKDDKDTQIEPSFTANAILSLNYLGESVADKNVRYLEKEQQENGGWRVLTDSGEWGNVTSYSTSLCVLSLILNKGDRNKIERGIEYLLRCQDESGKILRAPDEKETYHYLFYYVIRTLAFYLFSIDNSTNIEKFEKEKKNEFILSCYMDLLSSRALGVTEKSRIRRKDILLALESKDMEVAEIIDYLKSERGYSHLNKKSHITQIKSDVEYLRSIKLIGKSGNNYYISVKLI